MKLSVPVIAAMIACHIPTAHAQESKPYRVVTHSHNRALALLLGVLLPKVSAPGRSPRLCGSAAK